MSNDLRALLAQIADEEGEQDNNGPNISPEIQAARVLDHFKDFATKHKFQPGDLIQWKSGLKNRAVPEYGHPAVLIEHIDASDNSRFSSQQHADSGTPYCGEKQDIRVGLITNEGQFLMYLMDSRMFEPYTGPIYEDAVEDPACGSTDGEV